jgi:hypothetical protein
MFCVTFETRGLGGTATTPTDAKVFGVRLLQKKQNL